MKVICDRGALAEVLNLASGVVAARTPKPVLRCVKLTAEGEGLSLAATDGDISLMLGTPRVEVSEPGAALLPADKLGQIVRESIDPTVTITVEQDVAEIIGQDSRFKVFGYNAEEFPAEPKFDDDPDYEISAADLHRLVQRTIFATARENSRYAINGVLMERDGKHLSVVATDGHRLAMAKGACQNPNGDGQAAIVPTKALNLVLRLFDDAEQTVRVKIDDNKIMFATDDAVLASALVEGNFPPYKDVIPKDGDKKASLDTDTITSAFRRAALLTNEESKGVRMAFGPEGLVLSSRAPEMGEAEIKVDLPDYNGDEIEIGFNPQYVLDALKIIEEDQVTVEMKAANKPGVFKVGSDFLYVVMPVNLQ